MRGDRGPTGQRIKRIRAPRTENLADERVMAIWRRVCPRLIKEYPGGVVAIHPVTGDWFAGRDSLQAMLRALRQHPEGGLEVLRIGESPCFKMPWRPRRRVPRRP